jgi:hypothetical protein
LNAAAISSLWLSSTVTRPFTFSRIFGSKMADQESTVIPSSFIFWSLYPIMVIDIA